MQSDDVERHEISANSSELAGHARDAQRSKHTCLGNEGHFGLKLQDSIEDFRQGILRGCFFVLLAEMHSGPLPPPHPLTSSKALTLPFVE